MQQQLSLAERISSMGHPTPDPESVLSRPPCPLRAAPEPQTIFRQNRTLRNVGHLHSPALYAPKHTKLPG